MDKKIPLEKIIFLKNTKIKYVLEAFQETALYTEGKGFGLILDEKKKCIGVVTDGDIRTYLLNKGSLDRRVDQAMNKNFIYSEKHFSDHQILRLFDNNVSNIPVLDKKKKVIDIIGYSSFNKLNTNISKIFRARVPLRISFSGGGTDFSNYINNNNTSILTSSINKFATASILLRQDKKIKINSQDLKYKYEAIDIKHIKYGDKLDLIKAIIKIINPNYGFDIETYCDVQPGTGLGSSSAIAVAVIGAFTQIDSELNLDLYKIADLAYQAERIELKMFGGWQDQYATTFGGFNLIEFSKQDILVNSLKINSNTLYELEYNLLLFNLGGNRNSSKNSKKIAGDIKGILSSINKMNKITLSMKIALLKGNIKKFGDLLDESWKIKKTFNSNISNKRVNHLYSFAKKCGALGGKLIGAGETGFMLIYSSPAYHEKIIHGFKKESAHLESFSFTDTGLTTWIVDR